MSRDLKSEAAWIAAVLVVVQLHQRGRGDGDGGGGFGGPHGSAASGGGPHGGGGGCLLLPLCIDLAFLSLLSALLEQCLHCIAFCFFKLTKALVFPW